MDTPDEKGFATQPTETVGVTREVYFFKETPQKLGTNRFCENFAVWKRTPRTAANWAEINARTFDERDLALVRLRNPLILTDFETTAIVGTGLPKNKLVQYYVSGFGENNEQPKGGRKSYIGKHMDRGDCSDQEYTASSGCQPGIEFTVQSSASRTDSCYGDSGAGAYVRRKDGRLIVIAVVSRGIERGPCGGGGIYASLADDEAVKWIKTVANEVEITTIGNDIDNKHLNPVQLSNR